jgi:hypothetical protein
MKKILLIFITSLLFALPGQAQVLVLDSDMQDITDQTITINGTPDDSYFKVNIFLSNTGEETVDIFVSKTEVDIVEGAFNSFCWLGSCFTPDVFDVDDPLILEGDQISRDTDFYTEFLTGGIEGVSEVKYEFYSQSESFDTVSVTILFNIETTTGLSGFDSGKRFHLSDPQPNPARGYTWIEYTVPPISSNSQIVIRNLLGKQVYTENLSYGDNRIRINTQQLNNGIYIYSLIVDNQVVESKRLVVTN